jgi:lipopolysaccharide export LptBFGC system permease protein LptF
MTGENVVMLRYTDAEIERIRARRIYWEPERNAWLLEDGLWSRFDPAQGMQSTHRRITQTAAPLAERPDDLFATEAHPATLALPELRQNLVRAERYGLPTSRVEVDLHSKAARPFLPFVMLWLAAPFALRIRGGGVATAFGISIAIGLAYLLTFVLAQGMGHLGHIPPLAAAWGPNAGFLAVGAVLFLRTPS